MLAQRVNNRLQCRWRAHVSSSHGHRRQGFMPSFRLVYDFLVLDEAVRIYRDRVDTTFYQERGELRIIAGRFAADADFAFFFVRGADDVVNHALYRFISFIKKFSEFVEIAIDTE